jgi:hypothetical protein
MSPALIRTELELLPPLPSETVSVAVTARLTW